MRRFLAKAQFAQELKLPYQIAPATDPFFGKAGKLLAMTGLGCAVLEPDEA